MKRSKASIPHDIAVEILARLPIDSLIRFRCVCKLWCNLIYDPSFADAHTRRSHPQPGFIIPPICSIYDDSDECLCPNFNEFLCPNFLDMSTMKLSELPAVEGGNRNMVDLSFRCSCNGLLLLETKINSMTQSKFRVANLITRQYISILFPPNFYPTSLGLAYDAASPSRKYKVVCCSDGRMCVLTLGMVENSWRDIEIHHPFSFDQSKDPVFVNGHLYWMVIDEYRQRGILAMDVGREVVYEIEPPLCKYRPRRQILFEMNGSLCLTYMNPNSYSLQIWVLKDSEKGEWIEGFSIHMTREEFPTFTQKLHWIAYVGEPMCEIILSGWAGFGAGLREEFLRYDVKQQQRITSVLLPESIPQMRYARMHVNTLVSW